MRVKRIASAAVAGGTLALSLLGGNTASAAAVPVVLYLEQQRPGNRHAEERLRQDHRRPRLHRQVGQRRGPSALQAVAAGAERRPRSRHKLPLTLVSAGTTGHFSPLGPLA